MKGAFRLIVLGATGGPCENNLSGYFITPLTLDEGIVLDAGSLLGALRLSYAKGAFHDFTFRDPALEPPLEILRNKVKAYLLSHSHLDHLLGLTINSQCDTAKPIFGTDPTINALRDHIFNHIIWPNYGNEGASPIGQYHYTRLAPYSVMPIPDTPFTVEAIPLEHTPQVPSTAFLLKDKNSALLYLGDTISGSALTHLWEHIAPLLKEHKLKALFLECSYPKSTSQTYYHLNATLFHQTLLTLSSYAPLTGLKVIVTHRKESLLTHNDPYSRIMTELAPLISSLGIELIFPTQGAQFVL